MTDHSHWTGLALRLIEMPESSGTAVSKIVHFLSCDDGSTVVVGRGAGTAHNGETRAAQRLHLTSHVWPKQLCKLRIENGAPRLYRFAEVKIKVLSREKEMEVVGGVPVQIKSGDFLVYKGSRIRFFFYGMQPAAPWNRAEKSTPRARSVSPVRKRQGSDAPEALVGLQAEESLPLKSKVVVLCVIVLLLAVFLVFPLEASARQRSLNEDLVKRQRAKAVKQAEKLKEAAKQARLVDSRKENVINAAEAQIEEVSLFEEGDKGWVDRLRLYDEEKVLHMYNDAVFRRTVSNLMSPEQTGASCWWIPHGRNAQVVITLNSCVTPSSFESAAKLGGQSYTAQVFGLAPTMTEPQLLIHYTVQSFVSGDMRRPTQCIDSIIFRLNATGNGDDTGDGLCVYSLSMYS